MYPGGYQYEDPNVVQVVSFTLQRIMAPFRSRPMKHEPAELGGGTVVLPVPAEVVLVAAALPAPEALVLVAASLPAPAVLPPSLPAPEAAPPALLSGFDDGASALSASGLLENTPVAAQTPITISPLTKKKLIMRMP
mmetsp:Transcript_154228/g.295993  ORF Transcript_154228/g.295993 Transcript_154228/m.295993 type:complete len:137 (+) Transcript_154228:448-858(+)